MRALYTFTLTLFLMIMLTTTSFAAPPKKPTKAKFYDFSEQIIDGEIRKPTALYTNSRQKVKFKRLLRLKKSFMGDLFDTAKMSVFK